MISEIPLDVLEMALKKNCDLDGYLYSDLSDHDRKRLAVAAFNAMLEMGGDELAEECKDLLNDAMNQHTASGVYYSPLNETDRHHISEYIERALHVQMHEAIFFREDRA